MIGIFCVTKASTDEEYGRHLGKACYVYAGMIGIGVITAAVAVVAELLGMAGISDYMLGIYCGMGSGIAFGGAVLILRNRCLIRDKEKLHKARIHDSDERNFQISNMAVKAALAVLLAGMYLVMLIGGLWYPELPKILLFLVLLFLLSYLAACKLISDRI